jgi:bifunctional DNA-binding transcriptional regulator/antitoxin component of YhaV-PrlF toxin-antitoxin module
MQAGVSINFASKRGGSDAGNHIRVTKLGQLVIGPRFTRSVSVTGDLYEVTHTEDFGQIVLTKVQPEVAEELILGGKVRKQRKSKAAACEAPVEPSESAAAVEPALVA